MPYPGGLLSKQVTLLFSNYYELFSFTQSCPSETSACEAAAAMVEVCRLAEEWGRRVGRHNFVYHVFFNIIVHYFITLFCASIIVFLQSSLL